MDTAKETLGVKSDIKLAYALGMTSVCRWCDPHKPVIPEISVMLKLAELCKVPAEIALLDRAEMEAKNKAPESAAIFQNIKEALKKLPHIAAMLTVFVAISGAGITFDGGSSAFAGEKNGAQVTTQFILW
tara:strand:+ start:2091 stop:2480 length:390 start_codon:yes stop_codon:yes gene_type:complete